MFASFLFNGFYHSLLLLSCLNGTSITVMPTRLHVKLIHISTRRPTLETSVGGSSHFFRTVPDFSELNSEFSFLFSDNRVPIFLDTDDLLPHSLYSIWNFYWNQGLSGTVVFFCMIAIPNPYAHGFRLDNCTADCDVTVALHIHSHEVFKYLLIQRPSPLYVQLVTPENSSSSNSSSSSSSFSGDFEVIDDSEFDLNIDTL